jgi:geranylgeranyl reductase family protein
VDEAEVAVVGGGPAGSSAAARLAELGHEVLLIDQSGFPRDKPCGDGVTHHAVAFLERKGLGRLVEDSHPIEDVRVVIGHGQERSGFYRPWPQPPTYARAMPRRALDNGLFDLARDGGARFLEARVDGPVLEDGRAAGVRLAGDEGGLVRARCVIAADGATSRMRRESGFARERPGSHIFALRLYADTERELEPFFDFYVPLTYEGGLLAGYGWVFPVGPRRANIGVAYYEPPPGRPRARIRRVLDAFVAELEAQERDRLGAITDRTEPIGAPIATQFSPERCQLDHLIFAGEAARVADALNGEGISFSMESGEYAAEEAHALLQTGRRPAQGARIGRRFTRLGQDLTLPMRLVAGAATGLKLMDRGAKPFLTRIGRAASIGPEDPAIARTETGSRLLESDPGAADALRRADELLLDTLRTSFPFTLETMHRELRAGGGPLVVTAALAAARGVDGEIGDDLVAAAVACELPGLLGPCYREVAPETRSELARLNNAVAMLSGEFVLGRAVRSAGTASSPLAAALAEVSRRAIEGLAAELAGDGASRSPGDYLRATSASGPDLVSLAMRDSVVLAGDGDTSAALALAGRHLGTAWQIGTEVAGLSTGDEVARRPPGAELREGRITLPVLYALEADAELAPMLEEKRNGRATREILSRLRACGALDRAAEDCRREAGLALEGIESAGLPRPEPLRALARLSVDRLPVAA